MYIPGRSRTGWRPFRIEMSLAPYATRASPCEAVCDTPSRHAKGLVRGGVLGLFSVPETRSENGPSRRFDLHIYRRHDRASRGLVGSVAEPLGEVPRARRERGRVDVDRALPAAPEAEARMRRERVTR